MTPGIVAESDLNGNTQSEYVFFNGERVARRDGPNGTGGVFYYFSDHLKTASVITDATGNPKADSDYYPWGGELQFVANDSNHYKFTGKERDSETNLDYFGARYYSNSLGRFITPDWAAKAAAVPYAVFSDPQSLNLYSYVRNIPTTRSDPDGHFDDPFGVFGGQIKTRRQREEAAYWELQQLSIQTSASMATEQGNVPTSNTPTEQNNPGVYVCPSRACRFGAWWGKTKAEFNDFLCRQHVTCSMIPSAIGADPFVNPSGQWPAFVPSDWDVKDTKKMDGKIYIDPQNEHNRIRVMEEGYVKIQKNGRYFDVHGKEVLGDSAEAHIPINAVLQELIDRIFATK